jgi:purine-binding chemotaxis protein CheW
VEAQAQAAVLRERARQLAQRAPAAASSQHTVQVLAFSVAGQCCLVDLSFLCEVRPVQALLPVPLTRAPLVGLWPLRDKVLPVLDLPRLLGLEADAGAPARLVLALGPGAPSLGLPASAVHGVESLVPEQAQTRLAPLQGLRSDLVRGSTAAGHLWLDAPRLLELATHP